LTSWATTAKPGPASPTLAASKPPRIANDGRGARRLGEGLRNPLELAGGIERVVDDAADLNSSINRRWSALRSSGGRVRLLGAKADPSTKPFRKSYM
jgi:hypothetical protein